MNVAVPALLIFLLVLPGIVLRYAYLKGRFRNSPFRVSSFTDEIAYGIASALLLHVLWGLLLSWAGAKIDLNSAAMLVLGNFGKDSQKLDAALRSVTDHPVRVVFYFLGLYLASGMLGLGAHELVRSQKWDRRYLFFRFSNEWHYLLRGEVMQFRERPDWSDDKIALVYLSAVLEEGDKTFLYRGVVEDFFFDSAGCLDRIMLNPTYRRELDKDRERDQDRQDPAEDERYYTIEGHAFILKYSEVETLNLEYYLQEPEVVPDRKELRTERIDGNGIALIVEGPLLRKIKIALIWTVIVFVVWMVARRLI